MILDDERHHSVWFNTWQYAQFNMENPPALLMMGKISDAHAPDEGGERIQTLKRGLWAASRAVDYDRERDIDRYSELVGQSVGFNPRTMKRLLNTLQLLTILETKRHENFARIRQTLGSTPAVAAGLTLKPLNLERLLELADG